MRVKFVSVGKTAFPFVREGIDMYEKRIQKYLNYHAVELPDVKKKKNWEEAVVCREEGKKILAEINDQDLLILLDVKGYDYSSEEFAVFLNKRMISSVKQIVFVIGGAYGFSEAVYKRSDFLVSLSKMTFSHRLVRLIFVEQLYRGLSILKGEPYHH